MVAVVNISLSICCGPSPQKRRTAERADPIENCQLRILEELEGTYAVAITPVTATSPLHGVPTGEPTLICESNDLALCGQFLLEVSKSASLSYFAIAVSRDDNRFGTGLDSVRTYYATKKERDDDIQDLFTQNGEPWWFPKHSVENLGFEATYLDGQPVGLWQLRDRDGRVVGFSDFSIGTKFVRCPR